MLVPVMAIGSLIVGALAAGASFFDKEEEAAQETGVAFASLNNLVLSLALIFLIYHFFFKK